MEQPWWWNQLISLFSNLLVFLFLFVCFLLGVFVYDKRFRNNHGTEVPDGFVETKEVNIDPITGERTKVYYNEETGERFYKREIKRDGQ